MNDVVKSWRQNQMTWLDKQFVKSLFCQFYVCLFLCVFVSTFCHFYLCLSIRVSVHMLEFFCHFCFCLPFVKMEPVRWFHLFQQRHTSYPNLKQPSVIISERW
jgi:hypothetical protein